VREEQVGDGLIEVERRVGGGRGGGGELEESGEVDQEEGIGGNVDEGQSETKR